MRRGVFAGLLHNSRPQEGGGTSKMKKGRRGHHATFRGKQQFVDSNGIPLEGFQIWTEEQQHSLCPDGPSSWCKFKRKDELYDKAKYLDPVFFEELLPIYQKVGDHDLLSRYQHDGYIQGYSS